MELTLCLIVKNEELNLAECLSSFQDLYQKIIIVDTGSTDQTKNIAKQFGAEVFDFNWVKDFSAARNFALSKVKTTWVMMIDADDRMDPINVQALKEKLQKINHNIYGIFLPYLYSAIEGSQGVMSVLPRIWRTDQNYTYSEPIHEYLNIPQNSLSHFTQLPFSIIHKKTNLDFHKSFSRNIEILKNCYQQNPNNKRTVFYLGHDNHYAGNYQEAINWYEKYQTLAHQHPDELHKTLIGKGLCHLKLNQTAQAKTAFLEAIKINPHFIEPYLYLGEIATNEENYDQAAEYYFNALDCQPPKTHVFINTKLYHGQAQKKLHQVLTTIENLSHA